MMYQIHLRGEDDPNVTGMGMMIHDLCDILAGATEGYRHYDCWRGRHPRGVAWADALSRKVAHAIAAVTDDARAKTEFRHDRLDEAVLKYVRIWLKENAPEDPTNA